ncbi:MAG: hypothetical protein AAGC81_18750 [Pseudomonadota bacterium]
MSAQEMIIADLRDGYGWEDICVRRGLSATVVRKAIQSLRARGFLARLVRWPIEGRPT